VTKFKNLRDSYVFEKLRHLKKTGSFFGLVLAFGLCVPLNWRVAILAVMGNGLNKLDWILISKIVIWETGFAILTFYGSEFDRDWRKNLDIVTKFPKNYTNNTYLMVKGSLEGISLLFSIALICKLLTMRK
jgi:hypothetical protein